MSRGGLSKEGLSNSKVAGSDNATAAMVGGILSDGKVHDDDSTCLSKQLRMEGLQELGMNPMRVRNGEVDNLLLRQTLEYKGHQKGVVVPSVDLSDCDAIPVSCKFHSNSGLASADPLSQSTVCDGFLCDMNSVINDTLDSR
jgi:hypothetical protein